MSRSSRRRKSESTLRSWTCGVIGTSAQIVFYSKSEAKLTSSMKMWLTPSKSGSPPLLSLLNTTPVVQKRTLQSLPAFLSPRMAYPTRWRDDGSLMSSIISAPTREATPIALTRRGWVMMRLKEAPSLRRMASSRTKRGTVKERKGGSGQFDARRRGGSGEEDSPCVVFPLPVSPLTITIRLFRMSSTISFCIPHAGSLLLVSNIF
jgi:hypothetical protein